VTLGTPTEKARLNGTDPRLLVTVKFSGTSAPQEVPPEPPQDDSAKPLD